MLNKGADHTTIAMHDQPARKPLSSGVNRVTSRECDEFSASVGEERTATDKQRASVGLNDRRKGSIQFVSICGFHDQDLPPESARRHLHGWHKVVGCVRIH
jgi:hypothetical protein